jgi:hypothetical protein
VNYFDARTVTRDGDSCTMMCDKQAASSSHKSGLETTLPNPLET